VGRRGVKEYRAPEALALIAADRQHVPLVCPSCATRSIVRVPRRRGGGGRVAALAPERVTLTCQTCGRHASYIERGPETPRDDTMDPHTVRV
jgi:transposase-like protein